MAILQSLFEVGKGFSIAGETEIVRGSIDPSSSGYAAPISSLYIRDTGSDADVYLKTGAADTAWEIVNVGSAGSTEDGYIQAFVGKTANGSEAPTYSSTDVVVQGSNLEVALGALDDSIGTRTYTEDNYVTDGQDITTSVDVLDQQVKDNNDAIVSNDGDITALQTEEGYIQAFVGKTADGSETPTYSSTDVVTASATLETAIGELDASIGTRTYTEDNYVTDGQDVTTSVDALDQQVKDNADAISTNSTNISNNDTDIANLQTEEGYIQAFIGKTADGSETPTYSSTDVVTASATLETAVGELDNSIGTRTYTGDNYINDSEDITTSIDSLDQQVKANADAVAAAVSDINWIAGAYVITGDDISAASGTAVTFTDDNTGGVTLTAGDRIVSTHANSDDAVYIVDAGAWTTETLNAKDTYFTTWTLVDPVHQEKRSLYQYDGATNIKLADFDTDNAGEIGIAAGYTAANGSVGSTDTVQSATEKLDGNQQDILTSVGVTQGAVDLGTFSGTTISDNTTVKNALQELETAHEETDTNADDLVTLSGVAENSTNLGTFTGAIISDNTTVKNALQELETDVDAIQTLSGVAAESTDLGTFTGATIADSSTVKVALQAIETAHEETDTNADDLVTLSGVAENSTDLGTFTGVTIADNRTVKQALQDVETAFEETDANADDLITLSGVAEQSTDLGTFTGDTIADNQTIKAALQSLETELESNANNTTATTNITAETVIDSVVVDDGDVVIWKVAAKGNADASDKKTFRVTAMHDGTAGADAANVTYAQDTIMSLNDSLGITIDVDLDGTGATQVMRLKLTASTASDVTVVKEYI